ncbi:MAG: tetratricopeptide repeat protein [Candidatus Hodarchaeales archaeon]|jgi:tetratricopeptide (TPR) repeat protein
MIQAPSRELESIKELIDEGKFKEALQYLKDLKQDKTLSLEEKLICQVYCGHIYLMLGQNETALKVAEQLYQNSQELKMPFYSLDAIYIKALVLFSNGNFEEFYAIIEQGDNILKSIPKVNSLDYQNREAGLLIGKGLKNFIIGNLDVALNELKKGLEFYEQKDPFSFTRVWALSMMAYAYNGKGELDHALECDKKALSLIKDVESGQMSIIGSIYRDMGIIYFEKGDLDLALEHHKKSLEIYKRGKEGWWTGWAFLNIINVSIAQKNFTQAKDYLHQFKEFDEEFKLRLVSSLYQLSHALILKSSVRMRDRVEAENIFKEIIKKDESIVINIHALINLCD